MPGISYGCDYTLYPGIQVPTHHLAKNENCARKGCVARSLHAGVFFALTFAFFSLLISLRIQVTLPAYMPRLLY